MGHKVGPVGYGLMGLTWRPNPQPFETSFETMRTALECGATCWNGGELYGPPEKNSLHLLHDYFTKYPEDASKVVLNIKGGLKVGQLAPDGSEAGVRRSVENSVRILDGTKKIDMFECARVDPDVPVEETVKALGQMVREGLIGAIALSEVSASTIRRASAIHPIAAVEVELSLWCTDILYNGIAATCGELSIPILAYSPLCRGALGTGTSITRNADIPKGDIKRILPKFQDDVLAQNNRITAEVDKLAQRKGCTRAQVALAWVRQLSHRTLPDGRGMAGVIVPIPGATTSERVRENTASVDVHLTEAEMDEIDDILNRNPVQGDRYHAHGQKMTNG